MLPVVVKLVCPTSFHLSNLLKVALCWLVKKLEVFLCLYRGKESILPYPSVFIHYIPTHFPQ